MCLGAKGKSSQRENLFENCQLSKCINLDKQIFNIKLNVWSILGGVIQLNKLHFKNSIYNKPFPKKSERGPDFEGARGGEGNVPPPPSFYRYMSSSKLSCQQSNFLWAFFYFLAKNNQIEAELPKNCYMRRNSTIIIITIFD